MGDQLKILVCGNVKGQFSKLFKKLNSLQKKNGPFEAVLCPGQLFSVSDSCEKEWNDCKSGQIKAPLPIYVLGPSSNDQLDYFKDVSIEDGGELCENITYLGRKGIYTAASGLQIAYISGEQYTAADKTKFAFRESDVDELLKRAQDDDKFKGIDILMTATWPKDITKYTSGDYNVGNASRLLSLSASVLKPRYHLTCHDDHHFERSPYRNHKVLAGKQEHVTRFISLAPFLNKDNKKFLYAFSMSPICHVSRDELIKQPEDTTEFPYKKIILDKNQTDDAKQGDSQQFFFDQKKLDDARKRQHDSSDGDRRRKQPKGPPALSGPCWFCLGSPQVEKHLVISVGEMTYIALAKGGLNADHVLICPIHHYNSTVVLPEETQMELEKYKLCLRKMFKEKGMSLVIFERNFYTQHLQLQAIPIPKDKLDEAKEAFRAYGELQGLEMADVPEEKDLEEILSPTTPYFMVEFADGERLLHRVKSKMPLQFGREVLASQDLLNMPERVDWKECKVSKDQETKMTKDFRKRFTQYDFNFKS